MEGHKETTKTDNVFNEKYNVRCECGCSLFTHRHSNWIECISCHRIKILEDK